MKIYMKIRFLFLAFCLVSCNGNTISVQTPSETATNVATIIPQSETPLPTPTSTPSTTPMPWYKISHPEIGIENLTSISLIKSFELSKEMFLPNFIWFYPNSIEYQKIIIQSAAIANYTNWRRNSILDLETGEVHLSLSLVSPNGELEATNLHDSILEPNIKILSDHRSDELKIASECLDSYTDIKDNCLLTAQAFSPDGSMLITTTHASGRIYRAKYSLTLWDAKTGNKIKEVVVNDYTARYYQYVVFSPDGKSFISESISPYGGKSWWELYEVDSFRSIWKYYTKIPQFSSAKFSPTGNLIGILDTQGVVILEANTRKLLREISPTGGVAGLCFSSNGEVVYILEGGKERGKKVELYNIETGALLGATSLTYWANSIEISPDGKFLVTTRRANLDAEETFLDVYAILP